jgi:chlorobactene glucosyltransferase
LVYFLNYDMEIPLLLLCTVVLFSISFLFSSSFRSRLSIPIIERQRGYFLKQSLKLDVDEDCSYINGNYKPLKNDYNSNKTYTVLSNYDSENYKRNIYSNNSLIKNLPFISIIVPSRNEEKYIEKCLTSLLSQDYPNFEVIAVNDDSSDNTLKIIEDIKNSKHYKVTGLSQEKLKVISLKGTPKGWTGKTWASQNGYMQSNGSILLFTDADTHYDGKDVLLQTVLYMQNENLDVLTGIPSPEKLDNFWAKIAIPLWDSISVLFGVDSADVNNPQSKIAYLIGCFFLIKREVFVNIGTFESVRDAIQEDKALGVLIKKRGYNLKLVKLKEMIYTLWADDLTTLWHGIGRTLAPLVMKNRIKVILNLLIIFFASVIPFIIFPFLLSSSFDKLLFDPMKISFDFNLFFLLLDLVPCGMMITLVLRKYKEYGIVPLCSLTIIFASIFVIIACIYNIVPLLIFGNTKPILWQGRRYIYNKKQEGFTI